MKTYKGRTYKVRLLGSQSPFWYFSESGEGWLEMFSDTGSKISLWVKKEMFDYRVSCGDYKIISVTED